MRFVLEDEEEGTIFNPDASSVVAGRVKEIADDLEKKLREDQVSFDRHSWSPLATGPLQL